MKRRLLRVEMERRRAEDTRKERERGGGKTMEELRAASSRSRLARAGFRRPPVERRASIMHIGGCDVSQSPGRFVSCTRVSVSPLTAGGCGRWRFCPLKLIGRCIGFAFVSGRDV